jgi:hypothetical protein
MNEFFGLKPIQNKFSRLKKFLDLSILVALGDFLDYVSFICHEIHIILEVLR